MLSIGEAPKQERLNAATTEDVVKNGRDHQ